MQRRGHALLSPLEQIGNDGLVRRVYGFISFGASCFNRDPNLRNRHLQASIHRNDRDGKCFSFHAPSISLRFGLTRRAILLLTVH